MPELWFVFSLVESTLLLFVWKRNLVSKLRVLGGERRDIHSGERNHTSHRLTNERDLHRRKQPLTTHSFPVSTIHNIFPLEQIRILEMLIMAYRNKTHGFVCVVKGKVTHVG